MKAKLIKKDIQSQQPAPQPAPRPAQKKKRPAKGGPAVDPREKFEALFSTK
jgi:hypothetical protein